ncbi:MAG: GAF domain-containing sensor histidine kinase [Thermodesulfobacteriota bacterium]
MAEIQRRVERLFPDSLFRDFALKTEEGPRRIRHWIELVAGAVGGEEEDFYRDCEEIGYQRAIGGFEFHFIYFFYSAFREIVADLMHRRSFDGILHLHNPVDDFWKLDGVLFHGYSIVATSYLKTREEIIREKVDHLERLFAFTRAIVTTFEFRKIENLILDQLVGLFGVEGGILRLVRDGRLHNEPGPDRPPIPEESLPVLERAAAGPELLTVAPDGLVKTELDPASPCRLLAAPIKAHGRSLAVVALFDRRQDFYFSAKDRALLGQFLNVAAISIENALMLEEIESGRHALHLLTGKIITIEEEERKKLAGEIHDTLAQALSAIGIKLKFCRELPRLDPDRLANELDRVVEMVDHSLDQSRLLISNLRPDLIDTVGLVSALKRHITTFEEETGLRVKASLPQETSLCSDLNICLFRVAQEALMNAYKYAGVESVELSLARENGWIVLVVQDRGLGLSGKQSKNRLGLLLMRERLEAVGGTLTVSADPGRGCRIEARVPDRVTG